MTRKFLLACGILASLWFGAMNIVVPMQWADYRATSQTVSELSAIGAPTRSIWMALGSVYSLLIVGFGFGVWTSTHGNRALRIVGGLLIVHGIFAAAWPPMHQRDVLAAGGATLTDTLHLVWAFITVLLMTLEIGFAAAALGGRFRTYCVATIGLLLAGGLLTTVDAPGVQRNLPTPWIGVWERINIGVYLLWLAVLAVALWRSREVVAYPGVAARFEAGRPAGVTR
jgi:hypothetical protein